MTLKQLDHRQAKGLTVPISSASDVLRLDTSSDTTFTGTIATLPGGANLTYNITGGTDDEVEPSQRCVQIVAPSGEGRGEGVQTSR